MVSLKEVQASNAQIKTVLPRGLVAVFIGATRGIGCMTLREFARCTTEPRIYFVGRSQPEGEKLVRELKELNSGGEYTFIAADTSLIRNVDEVCEKIKSREQVVNLLFLTTGTPKGYVETSEGLHLPVALVHYSRARFITNLLPQLQRATSLRRVVSVFAGSKEGPVTLSDIQGWKVSFLAGRGHLSSLLTTSYEAISTPDVSIIHNFPGSVQTEFLRETTGVAFAVAKGIFWVLAPLICISSQECAERHVFLATSARYPARGEKEHSGVPLVEGLKEAIGTDGKVGSGVYSLDGNGESCGEKVQKLLAKFRSEGVGKAVLEDLEQEFDRIARM